MSINKLFLGLAISGVLMFSSTAFAATPYTVKKGDSLWSISMTYGTTVEQLKSLNRLTSDNLFIGQSLYVDAPAPVSRGSINRSNTDWLINQSNTQVTKTAASSDDVQLVDWFSQGKALFKCGEIFSVTDCQSGTNIELKVLSPGNHLDIEPASLNDTNTMKSLFGEWQWSPRPIIIHKSDLNIAGSLSGMPHSIDTTPENGVDGHFDLYLYNSKPHGSGISEQYVQQHYTAVAQAAGKQ